MENLDIAVSRDSNASAGSLGFDQDDDVDVPRRSPRKKASKFVEMNNGSGHGMTHRDDVSLRSFKSSKSSKSWRRKRSGVKSFERDNVQSLNNEGSPAEVASR